MAEQVEATIAPYVGLTRRIRSCGPRRQVLAALLPVQAHGKAACTWPSPSERPPDLGAGTDPGRDLGLHELARKEGETLAQHVRQPGRNHAEPATMGERSPHASR